jgi:hypothetical protein
VIVISISYRESKGSNGSPSGYFLSGVTKRRGNRRRRLTCDIHLRKRRDRPAVTNCHENWRNSVQIFQLLAHSVRLRIDARVLNMLRGRSSSSAALTPQSSPT